MERYSVFVAQFLLTLLAFVGWSESAGDGPGAPFWLIVDTFPVFLATFVVFLVSLLLRRWTNRVVMSLCIIGVYLLLRCVEMSRWGFEWELLPYFLLNPVIPELLCLIYYIREEKKRKESVNTGINKSTKRKKKELKNPVGTSVVLMILVFLSGVSLFVFNFVYMQPLAFNLALILIGVLATAFHVYAVICLMGKDNRGWRLLALILHFLLSFPLWFMINLLYNR